MVIVEIIPFLHPTNGAERFVINLTKTFIRENHKVIVISLYSKEDNDAVNELKQIKDIELYFLGKKRGFDFACGSRLKKLLQRINPDVIHCHLDSLITIWLSKIYKKYRVFFTFHTLINKNVVGNKCKIKNIVYRHLFKKNFVYPIAISNIIKESICNYYGLKQSFVEVVCNGVPTPSFDESKQYINRKYDFIYIGRFINIKNPIKITHSFLELKKVYKDSKMIMIGDGPLLAECKQISNNDIEFTGFVNDVSPYLANSKSLILFSDYEGNPMVINEAIASRCFVIATAVGGIPDVVDNTNGVLIDSSDNEHELVKQMQNFLCNSDIIDESTKKNYVKNRDKVSIDRTAKEYMDIFIGKNE